MADNTQSTQPETQGRKAHHGDKYGPKLVDKTQKYHDKFESVKPGGGEKKPAGGYDDTPLPKAPPGYTLRITFHRAQNLPFADIPSFSSDPYIVAVLKTDLQKRHKQDSDLTIRTPTVHHNVNPEWNTVWEIAHVPSSGFQMKCRLFDEDPTDHDDRLGNVHVDVDRIDDNWKGFKERKFEIKKRMGSKRAYMFRGCAAMISKSVKMGGEAFISVENLGKSEGDGGRAYTVSPLHWSQHFSPLIGMLAGTKDMTSNKDGKKSSEKYNFQAIQMQLRGPIPEHLYHRYVEFKPFVAGMFTSHTLRGRILNHALHHQHARIYNFDGSTKYGEFEEPGSDMTKKFLDFVHYDQGGRIFTYVITLDGQMRFTETGKEFGIDLLSKHTMHSDVSIYIAFSGEFFVRRLKNPHKEKSDSPDPGSKTMPPAPEEIDEKAESKKETDGQGADQHPDAITPSSDENAASGNGAQSPRMTSPTKQKSHFGFHRHSRSATVSTSAPGAHAPQTQESEEPSKDPSHYELIIDNDSGTYRPNAKYLPQLRHFLQANFPGMKVATLDCQEDEEKMNKLKDEQRERKKNAGKQVMYMQNSSVSSISSSEEEELARRADGNNSSGGLLKKELNKIKHFGHDDQEEQPKTPKAAEASSSSNANGHKNNMSISSDKKSFDTASEHGYNHFVTPKPSLGDGGLKAFDEEERPLSRDINKELEKRGLEGLDQDKEQSTAVKNEKSNGDVSSPAAVQSIHRGVTVDG